MEHKKHHYVPICYLKQFAYDKDRITYVYNKNKDRFYSTNINNICYKEFLYSLSKEYISTQNNTSLEQLSIEIDYFAELIEKEYNKVLQWLQIESKKRYDLGIHYFGLTDESKYIIAKYIIIQYLRTPYIQDAVVKEEEIIESKMLRLFMEGLAIEKNNPGISTLSFDIDIDKVVLHATETYLNDSFINRIANHFVKSYWHFYYSPKALFYSSDNPVTVIHRCKDIPTGKDYGLTDYGSEVSFPINPCLLLTIYDYKYFNVYEGTDGLFEEAIQKHINYTNVCQIAFSNNIVFCKSNNFTAVPLFKSVVDKINNSL